MGKSPAKWIKAVLFGKKSSKSHLSKDVTGEKKSAAKAPLADVALNSPTTLDPPVQNIDIGGDHAGLEKGTSTDFACDTASLSSPAHDIDLHVKGEISTDDAELETLELAATKAQAAFRGYLARRAFRALKGIIRLQALIRGHLVRRQAVATLRCMQGIVRIQALARGRRVRLLDSGNQLLRKYDFGVLKEPDQVDPSVVNLSVRPTRLTVNAFLRKLLVAVPTAMPLSLQYDVSEPNSARQWLERWSLSRFWEPLPLPKKVVTKSQRKQGNKQSVETEAVRPKRSVRKVPAAANGDTISSSEPEKAKRSPKKFSNHHVEPVQDQPQNELEKVKRNLRKVSAALATPSERSETEIEKPQQTPNIAQVQSKTSKSPERSGTEIEKPQQTPNIAQGQGQGQAQAKTSKSSASDVVEQIVVNPSEKMSEVSEIEKLAVSEAPIPVEVDEPSNELHEHPTVEQQQLEDVRNIANSPAVNEEPSSMEDQTTKERTRRRKSLPNKQENCENISQNTPNVPSYMAATASAKAKLKAQGSPKVNEDVAENGFVRRHSLPSSTSGKFNSLSPRVQRPVQANGKSGNKNRPISSSKDEKVLQTGWKR